MCIPTKLLLKNHIPVSNDIVTLYECSLHDHVQSLCLICKLKIEDSHLWTKFSKEPYGKMSNIFLSETLPPKKSSCGLCKVWIDLVCISDFQNVRKYPLEAHLFIHAQ
jgi:hypothetical protein